MKISRCLLAGARPPIRPTFSVPRAKPALSRFYTQPQDAFVLKYFSLIDTFVKVRSQSEGVTLEWTQGMTKREYQRALIKAMVPDYASEILPKVLKTNPEFSPAIVEELLYQIVIEVNPAMDVQKVSIKLNPSMEVSAPAPSPDLAITDIAFEGYDDPRFAQIEARCTKLEGRLKDRVIGQDHAIEALVSALKRRGTGLSKNNSPVGTFLMLGRTGVGKTETAKGLAEFEFGEGKYLRVDCSEFALPHEYAKLIGSPPGYIGYNEGGVLTTFLQGKPNGVVLFDEIEKAHFKVHNLLLQLLDEGRITDNKGKLVSATGHIILMTSNLGVERIDALRNSIGLSKRAFNLGDELKSAVREQFRPEFVNRVDEVIVFNDLSPEHIREIVKRKLMRHVETVAKHKCALHITAPAQEFLARQGFSEEFGGRELERVIKKHLEERLATFLLRQKPKSGATIVVSEGAETLEFSIADQGSTAAI